ncbi:MAG: polysaccharide biosynthesis/export family protein [Bacteroidota bacterium]|jgi:polysaccharide export outer membrane protein
MNKHFIAFCLLVFLLTGCLNTKKYRDEMQLFQKGLDSIGTYQYKETTLKPGDNLIIKVYTQATNNQEQATVLNMGGLGKTEGTYQLNLKGQIDLPKIGLQKVEGLTTKQVKALLITKWAPFVKDIGVNVQLEEITVNMIGEFRSPGVKKFKKEQVTLMDAFAEAGGLSDDGLRNDVLLVREENGDRKVYKIDFRDAKLYNSPFYQLQQNDLIVAGISDSKLIQRASQNFTQKFGPVLSVLSLLNFAIGITLLIVTLSK